MLLANPAPHIITVLFSRNIMLTYMDLSDLNAWSDITLRHCCGSHTVFLLLVAAEM